MEAISYDSALLQVEVENPTYTVSEVINEANDIMIASLINSDNQVDDGESLTWRIPSNIISLENLTKLAENYESLSFDNAWNIAYSYYNHDKYFYEPPELNAGAIQDDENTLIFYIG